MADEQTLTQNDRQAAIQEFRQSYGVSPNVESLIRANSLALSQAVREASYLPIDHKATDELSLDELSGKTTVGGSSVGDLGTVVAAAQRGHAIVVVIQDKTGRLIKDVIPADDSYVAPKEPAAMAAARAQQEADSEIDRRVQELRDDMAVQIAELRQQINAQQGEEIAKLQEESGEKVQQAAQAAEEAAQEEQQAETPMQAGDSSDEAEGTSQATRRTGSRARSSR
jgi:hypothetical protein